MGETTLAKVEPKQARGAQAFTLMEILVTISVILLLVGILIPVLGSARESGRRVKCQSNLRQLSTANSAYATDSKGWFCTSKPTAATAASARSDWKTYDSDIRIRQTASMVADWIRWGGLYESYLQRNGSVYYCPSSPLNGIHSQNKFALPAMQGTTLIVLSSYYQRGVVQGAPLNTKGQITTSSTSPLLAANWQTDSKPRRAILCDFYRSTIDTGFKPDHTDGIFALYSDDSVKWLAVPRTDWLNTTGPDKTGTDDSGVAGSWNQIDSGQLQ